MTDDYSNKDLGNAISTTAEWCEAFSESAEFAGLNESQQRKTGAITEFLARYAYEYLGVTPKEWTPGVVVECCTDILPRKISADPAFFEAIAPVLTAFFNFLGERSLHPKARELAKAAASRHREIVRVSQDRRNWGPAKSMVMAAYDAGVDIQDQKALNAFLVEFNRAQAAAFQAAQSSGPSWFPWSGARPTEQRHAFEAPANRYDPCPCGSGKKYKFCCASNG